MRAAIGDILRILPDALRAYLLMWNSRVTAIRIFTNLAISGWHEPWLVGNRQLPELKATRKESHTDTNTNLKKPKDKKKLVVLILRVEKGNTRERERNLITSSKI